MSVRQSQEHKAIEDLAKGHSPGSSRIVLAQDCKPLSHQGTAESSTHPESSRQVMPTWPSRHRARPGKPASVALAGRRRSASRWCVAHSDIASCEVHRGPADRLLKRLKRKRLSAQNLFAADRGAHVAFDVTDNQLGTLLVTDVWP